MALANADEARLLADVANELQCLEKELLKTGCAEDIRLLAKCSLKAPLPATHMVLGGVFVDRVTGQQSKQSPSYPIFVRLATLCCSARKNPSQSSSLASLVRLARDEALLEAEQTYDTWKGPELTQDGKEIYRSKTTGLETLTMPSASSLYIAYVANQVLTLTAFPDVAVEQAGTLNEAVERVRSQLWVRQQATALVNTANSEKLQALALPPVPDEYSRTHAVDYAHQLEPPSFEQPPPMPGLTSPPHIASPPRGMSPPRGTTPPPPAPSLPPPPARAEVMKTRVVARARESSVSSGDEAVPGRARTRSTSVEARPARARANVKILATASSASALPKVPSAPDPPQRVVAKAHDKLAALADSSQAGLPQPARQKAKVVATARTGQPRSPVPLRSEPAPPPMYQARAPQ